MSLGSATTLAIREIMIRTTDGGGVRWDSDSIKDHAIEVATALLISAVLVIVVIAIWVQVLFVAMWLLLFLLSEAV